MAFSIKIPVNDPEAMEDFQELMDEMSRATNDHILEVSANLEVSIECAGDIVYLRTRSRWSEENEKELIRLHKAGTPPNICEWP